MIKSTFLKQIRGFIDGRWIASDTGKTASVINPANGEHLAEVPAMGREETLRAIIAAEKAFRGEPTPLDKRAEWLNRIHKQLVENKKELGRIITLENGKPWKEAQAEIEYAAGFFAYAASHIEILKPVTIKEKPRGCSWTIYRRPAGVVALLTPWNFPIAMIAKKLASAMAADCSIIIKPSSKAPLSMIALFQILEDLDIPAGHVNLVLGSPGPITEILCKDPRVSVISFTGSTEVGIELIKKTADNVKKLSLELGGNAPYIVFADADLEKAADQLIVNKFRVSGQTCVCANRVLVQEEVVDDFISLLADRVSKLVTGDGINEDTDIGPLIDQKAFNKVKSHLDNALAEGAQKVAEGTLSGLNNNYGAFFPPTLIRNCTPAMKCFREETFGPLIPVFAFSTIEEAIQLANSTEYGLASYVFTGSHKTAEFVIRKLRFGHVALNTGTGPTPEAPFGGMKHSGFGREGGEEGLFEFVEIQTVPEDIGNKSGSV